MKIRNGKRQKLIKNKEEGGEGGRGGEEKEGEKEEEKELVEVVVEEGGAKEGEEEEETNRLTRIPDRKNIKEERLTKTKYIFLPMEVKRENI